MIQIIYNWLYYFEQTNYILGTLSSNNVSINNFLLHHYYHCKRTHPILMGMWYLHVRSSCVSLFSMLPFFMYLLEIHKRVKCIENYACNIYTHIRYMHMYWITFELFLLKASIYIYIYIYKLNTLRSHVFYVYLKKS